MAKIYKFPAVAVVAVSDNEFELTLDDIPDIPDIDYAQMFRNKSTCYKCGKSLNLSDYANTIYSVRESTGYSNEVEICSECILGFLGNAI